MLRALEMVALQLELLKAAPEEAIPLVNRAREICPALAVLDGDQAIDKPTSIGSSAAAAGRSCRPRPSTFRNCSTKSLFDAVDTVILTSATLAVAGGFEFTQAAAGPAQRAHAGGPEPLRLSEAGAALRAAESARSAQSGVHGGRGATRSSRF